MKREDFKFHFPFRVRFCETDPHGHVFNGNYYIYFDVAISEYFRLLGLKEILTIQEKPCAFYVKKTMAEYFAPIYFDEEIFVFVKTNKIGNTSIVFSLAVYSKNREPLLASGEVVWIYTNLSTGKKQALPSKMVEIINAFEKTLFMSTEKEGFTLK